MARPTQKGFTIVELLIVIVVIGILAAIVIVAFNGIQNRAHDASVRSDFASARKKIEAYKIQSTTNLYSGASAPWTASTGSSFNKNAYSTASNNLIYCFSTDGSEYALAALSKSGNRFYISNTKGVTDYTPAWTTGGGSICPNVLVNNTTTGTYTWWWAYDNAVGGWQF